MNPGGQEFRLPARELAYLQQPRRRPKKHRTHDYRSECNIQWMTAHQENGNFSGHQCVGQVGVCLCASDEISVMNEAEQAWLQEHSTRAICLESPTIHFWVTESQGSPTWLHLGQNLGRPRENQL